MDNRPRLFAVCKNDKDAKNIIKSAIDSAKKTWERKDEMIFDYENMEVHTPDYSYLCSYDYEKINCKKFLVAHRSDWERAMTMLANTI